MQIDKNVIRAIRQQVESFPAASYNAFNDRLNKAKETISRLTSFSERGGGLPQFEHVSQSAYSALTSDGISVENCFLYAYAAGLYWADSDWLDPYRYTSVKGTAEMMSSMLDYDAKTESHLFLSSLSGNAPRLLSNYSEWHRIIYARLSYEREQLELEVYPVQEKVYVTLESVKDNVFTYRDKDNYSVYSLTFNGEFLVSIEIKFYDENWTSGKTYIYSSNIEEDAKVVPIAISFAERIALLHDSLTKRKNDYQEISRYLSEQGVRCFYHFTDRRNLASIKENGGLFSWEFLKKYGIPIQNQGGDRSSMIADQRMNRQDYVRLSFCESHPMAYALRERCPDSDLVLLMIKPDVALFAETMFSDINAVEKSSQCGSSFEDLKRVKIAAIRMGPVKRDNPDFKLRQAEVLCKTFIPLEYIINLDNPTTIHF